VMPSSARLSPRLRGHPLPGLDTSNNADWNLLAPLSVWMSR
jgi:hypothetical protein